MIKLSPRLMISRHALVSKISDFCCVTFFLQGFVLHAATDTGILLMETIMTLAKQENTVFYDMSQSNLYSLCPSSYCPIEYFFTIGQIQILILPFVIVASYLLNETHFNCKTWRNTRHFGCCKYGLGRSLPRGGCEAIHSSNITLSKVAELIFKPFTKLLDINAIFI